MHELRTISVNTREYGTLLNEFKQYASVPDDSRDGLLTHLLRSALLAVQASADKALVETTMQLATDVDPEDPYVDLYLGGGTIESVLDEDGADVDYKLIPPATLRLYGSGRIIVKWTTQPQKGSLEEYKSVVLRYATALYDGEDSATCNKILLEVL